ncbi:predicted protein [Arabidopsis lyrata subsp. lyrata]|uniref:Predicted protein n=1 Tax=Arabidopsis lyrata subsp. lyrata TaxID=81972 RepID=D7MDP0_ARALL|nr:predicted protein [Arabidopsis lyrata subsp. lyrata]
MESINRTRVIAAYENMISDELRALLNSRPPKDVCCRARARRVAILKSRRIKARTRPPETGLVLPIYEDDYVHFLATDSDSDHGDREDQTDDDNAMDYDFVEHLDNADECIMEQEGEKGPGKQIKKSIIKTLKDMLDANNPHVIAFRSARDRLAQCEDTSGFKLILKNHRDSDGRVQNIPTTDEVAGLIVGDINPKPRDVVLQANSGGFQRISELHPSYLPLQYPLLFPYGEDGFRLGIDIGFIDKGGLKRTKVTSIWSISINFDFDFILREYKDKIVQI